MVYEIGFVKMVKMIVAMKEVRVSDDHGLCQLRE
jgi:hypothetical protein